MTELNGMKLYNKKETAELLHVTQRTIQDYLSKGKLRGKKAGHAWIITENAIREFLGETEKK